MKHIPQRKCIVCRAQKDKHELLRLVKTPSGEIAVDETGKLSGRGAYVCKDGRCSSELVEKRALNRAFGMQIPSEVYAELAEKIAVVCNAKR